MNSDIEKIAARVALIEKKNPVYGKIVQWVGSIISETISFSKPDTTFEPEKQPHQGAVPESWYKGKSFLDPVSLELDWEQANSLYKKIALSADRDDSTCEKSRQLLAIADMDENQPGGIKALMRAVLVSDFQVLDIAAKASDIEPTLLFFMLRMSLRPALLNAAKAALAILDFEKWKFGHCPVCGSAPGLAHLSDDNGKRILHCSLCESQWPYSRIGCPFCENCDSETLNYLYAENEEGWRIYQCDKCGHYLKTIDLRITPGPIILPLDDMATCHLDLIATGNAGDIETEKELD